MYGILNRTNLECVATELRTRKEARVAMRHALINWRQIGANLVIIKYKEIKYKV